MPFMGLGTGGIPCTEQQTEFSLRTALDLGYLHIDTARAYATEAIIGKVLKEYFEAGKLSREDVFITTKVRQRKSDNLNLSAHQAPVHSTRQTEC